jgi:ketosteroid isomerase-like protein
VVESQVEVVRSAYEAFARGDRDAALSAFAEDVIWEQAQGLPHGGVYRGLEAVREHVFGPLTRDWWETFAAPAHEFLEAAPHVVVLGRYEAVAKAGGAKLDVPFVHIWTFAEGRAVRFRQYLDTAGWNAALGSST